MSEKIKTGYRAYPKEYGISSAGPSAVQRSKEYVANNCQWSSFEPSSFSKEQHSIWSQFRAAIDLGVINSIHLQPLLEFFAKKEYALFTSDLEERKKGRIRKRVIIDDELTTPDLARDKEYIGPDRYDSSLPLLEQQHLAEQEGINCQVAVHVAAEYLGKVIDSLEDRSQELFVKHTSYEPVIFHEDYSSNLEIGDVIFVQEQERVKTAKGLHIGMVIGYSFDGMPWVLQSVSQVHKERPCTEIVPLSTILLGRHAYFYGAVRLPNADAPQSSPGHEQTGGE